MGSLRSVCLEFAALEDRSSELGPRCVCVIGLTGLCRHPEETSAVPLQIVDLVLVVPTKSIRVY